MSKYIIKNGSFREIGDDELMHWKYIKREKVNGKWRYWYDYKSLKNDVKSALNKLTTKTNKFVSSGKKTLQKYKKTSIKSTIKKVSDGVKDFVESVKKRVFKYVAKVPTDNGTYRYFYSDEAYQAYLKGKNTADKLLDKNLNQTAVDTAKANAKTIVANTLLGKFGEAIYNTVAPALAALQIELTTPKSFSELKKTNGDQTNDEHQQAINPDYNKNFTYDYRMNCSFCTAAYDLRKRGYDVEANPISMVEGYTIYDITSWYKDAQVVSQSTVEGFYRQQALKNPKKDALTKTEMLAKALESNGEGARGHLALYWLDGGGHDVIWEIENSKVVIRDCQTGNVVDISEYEYCTTGYDYVRVDNLECTEDILRTVRNRK